MQVRLYFQRCWHLVGPCIYQTSMPFCCDCMFDVRQRTDRNAVSRRKYDGDISKHADIFACCPTAPAITLAFQHFSPARISYVFQHKKLIRETIPGRRVNRKAIRECAHTNATRRTKNQPT